jgi:hydrogenase expression/formation protein HypC
MCLAVPGRVAETYRENEVLMGKVDFSGVCRRVCLEHVPDARVDDYVLVHVGFALSKIDAEEAKKVFEVLRELRELGELEAPAP